MSKMDKITEKAMKTARELERRKFAESAEMQDAKAAVAAAHAAMEAAALAGNEAKYAQEKAALESAQNRVEILRIREQKQAGKTDIKTETQKAVKQLEAEGVDEMRSLLREFAVKYADLLRVIENIDADAKQYNAAQEYFGSYVIKEINYHCPAMAELLPIRAAIDFRDKFKYQRGLIEKAAGIK